MRTRTHLTTPPGQEPALADVSESGDEVYVRGLALPEEPRVPGRRRRLWTWLAVIVVLLVVGAITFRVMTAGQTFDPALDPEFAPADDQLPGEG